MVVCQGDIFLIDLPAPDGSGPGYRHPHVVVQNNVFNKSAINTVIVCALTSNIKRADSPGNVSLKKGEGNLPKRSVVNVTQLLTVSKSDLQKKTGTLCEDKIKKILQGIDLVLSQRDIE